MGRKNIIESFQMFENTDLSTNQTSASVNIKNQDVASIHLVWSNGASLDGLITVEARNGSKDSWYTIDMGGSISISGVSGDHELRFNQLPGTEIRLQYVANTGSGDLTATITSKVIGA